MSSITYRKDIDGLRAVAVMSVILGHAQFSFFPGGFVGVDIFFVISGFLITSIILKEMDKGRFSFKNFYLRRIKRIMPALIVVVFATVAAGYFLLMPSEFIQLGKSSFATLTAWNNFFIEDLGGGYWARNTEEMPLMHTWSLGIEEQFYLAWPFVLLFLFKIRKIRYFKVICCLILAVLTLLSQLLVPYVVFAYFLPPARFFELYMGCVLALLFDEPLNFGGHSDKLNLVGIGLIAYAILAYQAGTPFPGMNAFWPCLGAALILIPKKTDKSLVNKLLSSAPCVFVGKISYSLYLWHWPFIAFLIYLGQPVEQFRLPMLALVFLLSVLSYYLVEQPARKSKRGFGFFFPVFFVVPSLAGLFFCLSVVNYDGFTGRFAADLQPTVQALNSVIEAGELHSRSNVFKSDDSVHEQDVILMGDSHALGIQGFIEVLMENAGLKGVVKATPSNLLLKNLKPVTNDKIFLRNMVLGDKKDTYSKSNDDLFRYIKQSKSRYVVIAGRYSTYNVDSVAPHESSRKATLLYKNKLYDADNGAINDMNCFKLALTDTVKELISSGKIPVIVKDVPELKTRMYLNGVLNIVHGVDLPDSIDKEFTLKEQRFVDNTIDELKKRYPQVIVIDPKELMSVDNRFVSIMDRIPLYGDKHHLNYDGSRLLGKKWLKLYGNPFDE